MDAEKQVKILVVDDDKFVLNLLNAAFNNNPEYVVTNATNGHEALEKTREDNFDLIITDIVMPKKDGIAFINEVRETDKMVPIIAISGGGNDQPADDYINFAGYFADQTLTKPFTQEELLSAVRLVLSNKAANALNFL